VVPSGLSNTGSATQQEPTAEEGECVMDEGSSKAIPLRRSRGGTRAVIVRAPAWLRARRVFAPPRQLWLASLGGTALTLRGVREAWARLVAEGVSAETWLRRSLGL
jgi:hypothetical protein